MEAIAKFETLEYAKNLLLCMTAKFEIYRVFVGCKVVEI